MSEHADDKIVLSTLNSPVEGVNALFSEWQWVILLASGFELTKWFQMKQVNINIMFENGSIDLDPSVQWPKILMLQWLQYHPLPQNEITANQCMFVSALNISFFSAALVCLWEIWHWSLVNCQTFCQVSLTCVICADPFLKEKEFVLKLPDLTLKVSIKILTFHWEWSNTS